MVSALMLFKKQIKALELDKLKEFAGQKIVKNDSNRNSQLIDLFDKAYLLKTCLESFVSPNAGIMSAFYDGPEIFINYIDPIPYEMRYVKDFE